MTEPLITLDEAMRDLKLTAGDDTDDLMSKMKLATEIVIEFIKEPDHEWTPETAPGSVKAAILLTLRSLYDGEGGMPEQAEGYLRRRRLPSLA